MTKYSKDFKTKLVKEYLQGGISYVDLCAKYGIPATGPVRRWVQLVKVHGFDALQERTGKSNYTKDYKLGVVDYVQIHDVSRMQAAAHFGISPTLVCSWMKIVQEQGISGLHSTYRERSTVMPKKSKKANNVKLTQEELYKQENVELKAKLHKAELDRDILKAFATLTRKSKK